MIQFINLPFLLLMGIPLVIFGYLLLTDKDRFLEIFKPNVLKRLSVTHDSLPPKGRKFLLLMALFWMIVAMARPVIDHGDKHITIEGLHAVVALDISASMRTTDSYPNRLEFAKQKILELLDQMPYDELSLIAFAQVPFMVAPFSSDKMILGEMLKGINSSYINMGSTDLVAMGRLVVRLLQDKKEKILILFTDGDDAEDFEAFSELLKEHHITAYLVLVGTKQGGPVLDQQGKPLIYQGKMAITQRHDELGHRLQSQGGASVVARTGSADITQLVKTIRAHHQTQTQGEVVIHNREELFYYPLGLGLLFLLMGLSSFPSQEELRHRWQMVVQRWRR